ncbi:hypothetical protein V2G26_010979 [Clonostachys chloroleuca]
MPSPSPSRSRSLSPPPRPYEIRGFEIGSDSFYINIRVNGVRFDIPLSPDSFVRSPKALALFKKIFSLVKSDDDSGPDVWAYAREIADHFLPELQRLAPKKIHTGKLTLADLKASGYFECEYKVVKERPTLTTVKPWGRQDDDDDPCADKEWDMRTYQSTFPLYSLEDVEVPYTDGESIHDIIPQRAFVNGKTCFYKSCYSPWDALEEVTKYCKIAQSSLSISDLRTSRLSGIVTYRDGLAKGLLYDWIETKDPGTLTWAIEDDVPRSQKNKWTLQIRDTVRKLHSLGVVWGDVKADNVLIGMDKNAVVIDLEGGTTKGWVDRELLGTIEGDQQGLKRLVDFILNDESPLRLRNRIGSDCEYDSEEEE